MYISYQEIWCLLHRYQEMKNMISFEFLKQNSDSNIFGVWDEEGRQ